MIVYPETFLISYIYIYLIYLLFKTGKSTVIHLYSNVQSLILLKQSHEVL